MKKIFFYIILGVILIACLGAFIPKGNQNQTQDIPRVDASTAITVTCHEGLTYAITDTAGNEVTEFKQNTDYTITATGSYGYNVSQIRINDIAQTGTSVTFNTATNEEMTISISAMPKSIESSDLIVTTNCDYSLTPGPAMYYGNTYTLDANTEDYEGYTISTVVYKGETHALPYTFTFTDLEEKFYLNAELASTAITVTCHEGLTYAITDTAGNEVTEYKQNTDYTITAIGSYGYNVSQIRINDIAQTGTSVTFNTATNEEMTISIIAIPKMVEASTLVVATNCDYSLGLNLVYGETYTLDANTEDYEGYTISTVVYKGETHSLPYTFTFTDLEEKFYLNATAIVVNPDSSELGATTSLVYTLSEDESYYIVGTGFDSIEEIESFSNSGLTASGLDSTWTGGELVIPSNYNGLPVKAVAPYAFNEVTNISSVYIADGVTHLGKSVFRCTKDNVDTAMISCRLPNSLTFFGADGVNNTSCTIFQYRTALEEVNIPNNVKYIGTYAFNQCSNLTNITIPDKVTSLGNYAFNNCSSLISIIISDSVTSLGNYAFNNCSSLTSIIIPDSVTSLGDCVFQNCSKLTSITIPDAVVSLGQMAFQDCNNLEKVIIGESVTNIPLQAFAGCTAIKSVKFGGNIKSVGYLAFNNCINAVLYDFSNNSSIPNLYSTQSLGYASATGCKCVVPDDLYDSWIIANVWSALASKIVKASEYVPA